MSQKRPIQTDSQSLGDVGETTVQLILQKFKWTADIIKSDFGEDIDCNIFIDTIRTNYHFRCQVKSSRKDSEYIKELKNGNFSVSIESNHLRAWQTSYFPVLLIIYNEDTDTCYWTVPIEQISQKPEKLNANNPTINISKLNIFDATSKDTILNKVKDFYRKFLRLDESTITCNVIPVLMPDYKIIPTLDCNSLLHDKNGLQVDFDNNLIELLPSWMTVLKRIDPSPIQTFLKIYSLKKIELEEFIYKLQKKLLQLTYQTKKDEWISFIISPIKISSNKSSWENELTSWLSYSKINNEIMNDFDYSFGIPDNFLRQISRRSMSWDSSYFIEPNKDIAIRFYSTSKITPTILNINQIHYNHIQGQYILWECLKKDIDEIQNKISKFELIIQVVDNKNEKYILIITTPMFNPSIGLYTLTRDWDSYENGNVRNVLNENNILKVLPGMEYKDKTPESIEEILKQHANIGYTSTYVDEENYISGFPLMQNQREIHISRFQAMTYEKAMEIELKIESYKQNFQIELIFRDDTWGLPIYEIVIALKLNLRKSSKEVYLEKEDEILKIFNSILPTNTQSNMTLENSFDILHIAGQIQFENKK